MEFFIINLQFGHGHKIMMLINMPPKTCIYVYTQAWPHIYPVYMYLHIISYAKLSMPVKTLY